MNDAFFRSRYGPWCFIAGASEGLGEAFAYAAAARGLNVILAARRGKLLERIASDIRAQHGVEAVAVPLDLAGPMLEEVARRAVVRREVGLFVHNAAYVPKGDFLEVPVEDHLRAVDVNVRALLTLTHAFGGAMAKRGRGGIVLMSSLASFQGTGCVASYAGTKAFGRVFGEGLWEELRDRGVDVLACCAGATKTPGYEAFATRENLMAQRPEEVVEETFARLQEGPVLVPGRANKLAGALMGRLLPRRTAVQLVTRQTRKLYGR
ncbi:MAG: SDR family NAD(P)-dependent oxidoreductase [Myxococcota bacterium]